MAGHTNNCEGGWLRFDGSVLITDSAVVFSNMVQTDIPQNQCLIILILTPVQQSTVVEPKD